MDNRHLFVLYVIAILIGSLHLRYFQDKSDKHVYYLIFVPVVNVAMAIVFLAIWVIIFGGEYLEKQKQKKKGKKDSKKG